MKYSLLSHSFVYRFSLSLRKLAQEHLNKVFLVERDGILTFFDLERGVEWLLVSRHLQLVTGNWRLRCCKHGVGNWMSAHRWHHVRWAWLFNDRWSRNSRLLSLRKQLLDHVNRFVVL